MEPREEYLVGDREEPLVVERFLEGGVDRVRICLGDRVLADFPGAGQVGLPENAILDPDLGLTFHELRGPDGSTLLLKEHGRPLVSRAQAEKAPRRMALVALIYQAVMLVFSAVIVLSWGPSLPGVSKLLLVPVFAFYLGILFTAWSLKVEPTLGKVTLLYRLVFVDVILSLIASVLASASGGTILTTAAKVVYLVYFSRRKVALERWDRWERRSRTRESVGGPASPDPLGPGPESRYLRDEE